MGYTVATRYTLTIRLARSTEDRCAEGKAGQAVRRCFPRIDSGGPALLS
jgi:hypothetical protein